MTNFSKHGMVLENYIFHSVYWQIYLFTAINYVNRVINYGMINPFASITL